jgi:hypothetical protein
MPTIRVPRRADSRVVPRAVLEAFVAAALVLGAGAGAPATARAQETPPQAPRVGAKGAPTGTPVRWDQQRMARYGEELAQAAGEAEQQVRKSPLSNTLAQRQVQYDLREDLKLFENASSRLAKSLAAGEDAEQTRATFDRTESLRLKAEEHGRRAMIEDPVMDALVKAGAIHNQMRPYYYGKR